MRQTLVAFTERAIEASQRAKLVNPVAYLPRTLRGQKTRLTVDNLKITVHPETMAENHKRIAKSDPLGHLIACMNGQPIPSFKINDDGSVDVQYEITPLAERTQIAQWLASRITFKIPQAHLPAKNAADEGRASYDAMIKGAVPGALQKTD